MGAVATAFPALVDGALTTLRIALQAGALAVAVSFLAAAARLLGPAPLRWAVGAYVEFFRGTSAFVQLFWAYFALPMVGLRLTPEAAGVAILALNVGAYGSEVVRASVAAVPKGQIEACRALGLGRWTAFRLVIAPQATIRAILPMGNLLIDLIKGTSLLSAISVTDLAFAGRQAASVFGEPLAMFAAVLLLYLLMTAPVAWGAGRLDLAIRRRMALAR